MQGSSRDFEPVVAPIIEMNERWPFADDPLHGTHGTSETEQAEILS